MYPYASAPDACHCAKGTDAYPNRNQTAALKKWMHSFTTACLCGKPTEMEEIETMERTPQKDLRYIKTENLIQDTFRSMLREMDYADITIKELTNRAMINRKTFYLHYDSLDALLGKMQEQIYQQILESLSEVELPGDLEKLVRELFLFTPPDEEVDWKILYSKGNFPGGKSPGDYALKSMYHYSQPRGSAASYSPLENNLIDAFLRGSMIGMYSQWVEDGQKLSLEELIQMTARLISKGMEGLCGETETATPTPHPVSS
ncbi:MAG: TetR family transcriptional regulator C-terminal domain-containing protein [Roseburia sp.]|nr:TetR family transcriptional regulator C-terminal domain-containing protein [Roseburia sp.]